MRAILFALILVVGFNARASQELADVKMDIQTQDALITKLEEILPQLKDDKQKITTVRIRLADLYSERARLKDMAAGETNCYECKDAEKDRSKAISFYESNYSKVDASELQRISLQLAHLYKLNDRIAQAQKTYNNILSNRKMKGIHSKAHIGLADIAFEQGNYEKAKREYALVQSSDINDKIYVAFRQAWTELNIGRNAAALAKMQSAVTMAKNSGASALHKDLMRDYATILARNSFTAKDVDKFIEMSPVADRADNLKFLGEEAERLGNKRGTLLIWTQYRNQENKKETAEIQMKLAQNFYDLNDYAKTLAQLDLVVESIKKDRCEDCKKVTAEFRSLLITWNKREKTEPSKNLTAAYAKYLKVAEDDFETMIWAGQVARAQKDLRAAYNFYEKAAFLAAKQKKTSETEMTSATAIEIAESLNDSKTHLRSLNNYLDLNPKGERRNLVLYQMADLSYQAKDFTRAAKEFQKLALDDSWKDRNLRIQAADLSLDAIKQSGNKSNTDELRKLALVYAGKFKEKHSHFSEIARKVTINNVVTLAQSSKADASQLKDEVATLKAFSVTNLPLKDQIAHLKTQIIAAEKIGDVNAVEKGSRDLLKIKGISNSDRDFAEKSLLWVYELRLDFKNAYAIAKKMPMGNLSKHQRILRIGLLAELAGANPESYFRQYVAISPSLRNSNEVRLKLIRSAKNQWKEYDRMFSKLRKTPDLLANITLELHLAKPNMKQVKAALAVRGVFNTAEGQYMNNLVKRQEFDTFLRSVSKSKINASNDRSLKRSIKERVKLLERLSQRYTASLRGGDLSLQIMTLNAIAAENQRFYREINRLPIPRGLSRQERETYKKMLLDQSAPYAQAAKLAEDKRADFFNANDKAVTALLKLIQSEDKGLRSMAMNEYKFLKAYMNRGLRNEFEENIRELQINPKKVVEARREVESNPLDPSTLAELRELESKRANGPLLAYLDERIAQLKTGARR